MSFKEIRKQSKLNDFYETVGENMNMDSHNFSINTGVSLTPNLKCVTF